MNYESIYYVTVVFLIYAGFNFVYDAFYLGEVVKYKPSVKRSTLKLLQKLSDDNTDELFYKIGINLPIKKYTAYRNLITLALIVLNGIEVVNGALVLKQVVKNLSVIGILYIISDPKEYRKGKKTIFKKMLDTVARKRLELKDGELLTVIGQMKNMILSANMDEVSTDYLLSRLMHFTKLSRANFIQALGYIRKGERDKAYKVFSEDFGTKLGKDFGRILVKLDYLPANEFLEQLSTLQQKMKDEKEILKEKSIQNKKLILYVLAGGMIALIIFNYLYIVMFDTTQMMQL